MPLGDLAESLGQLLVQIVVVDLHPLQGLLQ